MRRILRHAVVAAIFVVGLAFVVGAQPPAGQGMPRQGGMPGMRGQGPGGPGGRGMGPGGPMAALKLTAEQQKQVQAIMEADRADHQALADQLRAKHEALRDALFGDNPDSATGLAGEIGQLEAQMLPARVAMQIKVLQVLTPDQRKLAKDLDLFGGGPMGQGRMGPGMRGGRGTAGQPPVKK